MTNFVVNSGSPVTDAQVTSGVFTVAAHLYDTAGVESTNTAARFFVPNSTCSTPTAWWWSATES